MTDIDELDEEDDGILMPKADERAQLIAQLAELVRRAGFEALVLTHLISPTEEYFPDPWRGGEASLRRLVRRLMIYADLEQLDVEVAVFEDAKVGGSPAPAGPGANVWFEAIERGTVRIAAREAAMREPDVLVPAAARAVTEAWRAHHGLALSDARAEQRLVDVSAAYLGFGILTADASLRHGARRTGGFRLERFTSHLGVLSPQAITFCLAVVVVARGLGRKERKAIVARLQANQAGFLTASIEVLERHDPPLREALGIPPRDQWPEPPSLSGFTYALPALSADPSESREIRRDEDKGILQMNEGRPVFRVERTKATRLAKMLGLPPVLLGVLASRANMGVEIEMWQAGAVAAGLGLLGLIIGRFLPDVRCSEPKCATPLTAEMETCPRCGGRISGVIHHSRERVAAEDALERSGSDSPEKT